MKKKVLASIMALGVLFSCFAVQAATEGACDHTNINSFDSKPSTERYFHFVGSNNDVCCMTITKYFTTYACLDCGTIVDVIDHEDVDHSIHHD